MPKDTAGDIPTAGDRVKSTSRAHLDTPLRGYSIRG